MATLITPESGMTVQTGGATQDVEVTDLGLGYEITWAITGSGSPSISGNTATETASGLVLNETYTVDVVVSDTGGVCPSDDDQGFIERVDRSVAKITSSDADAEACSDTLITSTGEVLLTGSTVGFPSAPFNEKAEWVDIDGALGTPNGTYTTPTLTIDTELAAGTYNFTYTITNDNFPTSPSVATYVLTVIDVPGQPSITGPASICEDSIGTYSVGLVPTATDYMWRLSNSQAIINTGQGSDEVKVNFIQQAATTGATGTGVTVEVSAKNECGLSIPATETVTVNLKPRSADYLNSIVEIQGGGNSICETTTGEVLETTPTGTNHTEYRWSFGGLDLGTTTSATLNVSKSEMPAFTDAASTIIVEYGNACGYYGAEADTTIELLSEKPFEVALSLDNESPLDSVLTRDLYAICGLESAYDIKVEGGSGVNLTGVDVEYDFTIVGNPTGGIPSNQSDGSLLLPGIENLTDGDIIVNASLTDPSQGCFTTSTASDQISLRDYTFEAFTIVGDNLICESDNDLSLSVSSGQATADDKHYKIEEAIWTLGDGSVLTGTTITLGSPSQQGDISVELTNIKGCQEFYSKAENGPFEVTIDEKPVIILEGKPVITVPVDVNNDLPEYQLNGYVTNLQPTDYVASWNAESLTSKLTESEILAWLNDQSIVNPIIDPLDEEVARLVVTVVNGACESKDSIDIRATKPFLPPTAFTPNGDGLNDSWVVEGLTAYNKAVMKVYNRWGQLVFEKYGGYYDQFDGKNLPMATYYWTVEFNEPDKAPESGTVTILK